MQRQRYSRQGLVVAQEKKTFLNLYFHVVLPLNSRQATKSDCDANYGIVHCFKHCDVDSQLEDLKL